MTVVAAEWLGGRRRASHEFAGLKSSFEVSISEGGGARHQAFILRHPSTAVPRHRNTSNVSNNTYLNPLHDLKTAQTECALEIAASVLSGKVLLAFMVPEFYDDLSSEPSLLDRLTRYYIFGMRSRYGTEGSAHTACQARLIDSSRTRGDDEISAGNHLHEACFGRQCVSRLSGVDQLICAQPKMLASTQDEDRARAKGSA